MIRNSMKLPQSAKQRGPGSGKTSERIPKRAIPNSSKSRFLTFRTKTRMTKTTIDVGPCSNAGAFLLSKCR